MKNENLYKYVHSALMPDNKTNNPSIPNPPTIPLPPGHYWLYVSGGLWMMAPDRSKVG